jgi:[acyl-carrier-protein] S-malonyltransferase
VVSKIAFLYPGQGSQRVGMGAELRASQPHLFERHFSQADAASGLPVTRYCLEGPIESLTQTQVAQPALFTLSTALTDYARQLGLRPDFVAGHSLGEYTAAVASGALGAADGIELVARRGQFMAEIQSERPGAMAAVIGLTAERLQELCDRASSAGLVTLANLNTPTQIVVSGEEAPVEKVLELAREAGAERALRLQVGAGFHTELMAPVQHRMAALMKDVAWQNPEAPLAANCSGEILATSEAIRQGLIAQIASPVRWVDCMRALVNAGCTTFVELGPGRVLTGLLRQINPDSEGVAVDSPEKIDAFVEAHRELVRG